MSRYRLLFCLAIITAILASLPVYAESPSKKANFIFVLSDDVAQGDLGCYGQKLIQTPRIDQIAAEGTRYLQAYCGTSVCAPSRSSFFTGLHTGHCPRPRQLRGPTRRPTATTPTKQSPSPRSPRTPATPPPPSANGAWASSIPRAATFNQGVDHFFGYNCQRHAHSYFPTYLYDEAQPFVLPGNDGQTVGKVYAQQLIQNDMIDWVRKHADKPFLLFYAITLPHGRHEIDDLGIYRDKPWTDKQKAYAAQVTRLDSDMGQLVDTLRELGIAKNTLLVFSGDNGSSFDPKSEIGKRFDQASNGLRGFKRGMYEGALRQAAFAWWPGTVPAGRCRRSTLGILGSHAHLRRTERRHASQGLRNRRQIPGPVSQGRRGPETRLLLLGTASRKQTDPGHPVWQLEGRPQWYRQTN